jgi:hypothetical protein
MTPLVQARIAGGLKCGNATFVAADPVFSVTAYKQASSCLAQTIYFHENKLQIIFMRDNPLYTNSEYKFLIVVSRIL